jgi:fumarate reductase subunit C
MEASVLPSSLPFVMDKEIDDRATIPYSSRIMAWWDDWLDIPFLQFLSREASAAIAALLTYAIVGRLVAWLVGSDALAVFIEVTEKAVLVLIFLYFPIRVGYHLYKEVRARGGRH